MADYRVVLLNALPLNMFPESWSRFAIQVWKVSEEDLLRYIAEATEVKCYIRHPATVQFLRELLGEEIQPSSELYKYDPRDVVFIVTLRAPVRGQEATEVSAGDVEIYKVYAREGVWL
jgi:hypothetical protein